MSERHMYTIPGDYLNKLADNDKRKQKLEQENAELRELLSTVYCEALSEMVQGECNCGSYWSIIMEYKPNEKQRIEEIVKE